MTVEDNGIVMLYFDRDEQAIAETEKKYGGYCLSLAQAIVKDPETARECVNDTWLRAWNAIPPQKPVVLRLFLAKITRNLAFNTYRQNTARKRGGGEVDLALEELKDCVPAQGGVQDALDARELGRVIQEFLQTQSRRDRNIFIRRYFCVESISAIAERLGLTEANTRKILTRTRNKLRDYLTKEGYTV